MNIDFLSLTPEGEVEVSPELELLNGLEERKSHFFNVPLNKTDYSFYLKNPSCIEESVMNEKIDSLIKLGFIEEGRYDNKDDVISITDKGEEVIMTFIRTKVRLRRQLLDDKVLEKLRKERIEMKLCGKDRDELLRKKYSLHYAIENKDLDNIKTIVESGFDVNSVRSLDYETPLSLALQTLDLELVQYLISKGANLERKNSSKKTLLNSLCDSHEKRSEYSNLQKSKNENSESRQRSAKVKLLLKVKANVNTFDDEYMSPLLNALMSEHNNEIIKELIRYGAKIDHNLYDFFINMKHFNADYKKILIENESVLFG